MPLVPPTCPPYKNVPRVIARLVYHLLTGAPASLSAMAAGLLDGMTPPPRTLCPEWIPPVDPFVLIFNHYESARVAAWWGPLLMARTVTLQRRAMPCELRPVMTREWWYPPGSFGRAVKQPLTRLLFARLAGVYGLVLVPPVLRGESTRGEGVAGVRQALALTRGANPQLVALAPEGHTGPRGTLKAPPPGAGQFLLWLSRGTLPLLPAGWFEDEQARLTIRFGEPFQLDVSRSRDREATDCAAAARAMTAIGRLLPSHLWGAYADQLSA
jgi:hypothetical protein